MALDGRDYNFEDFGAYGIILSWQGYISGLILRVLFEIRLNNYEAIDTFYSSFLTSPDVSLCNLQLSIPGAQNNTDVI